MTQETIPPVLAKMLVEFRTGPHGALLAEFAAQAYAQGFNDGTMSVVGAAVEAMPDAPPPAAPEAEAAKRTRAKSDPKPKGEEVQADLPRVGMRIRHSFPKGGGPDVKLTVAEVSPNLDGYRGEGGEWLKLTPGACWIPEVPHVGAKVRVVTFEGEVRHGEVESHDHKGAHRAIYYLVTPAGGGDRQRYLGALNGKYAILWDFDHDAPSTVAEEEAQAFEVALAKVEAVEPEADPAPPPPADDLEDLW